MMFVNDAFLRKCSHHQAVHDCIPMDKYTSLFAHSIADGIWVVSNTWLLGTVLLFCMSSGEHMYFSSLGKILKSGIVGSWFMHVSHVSR